MAGFDFDKMQGQLGETIQSAVKTNADICMVIDATESMTPIIDTVKEMALNFYDEFKEGLKEYKKELNQTRIKVIVFRDYYCDGAYAMEESDFFYLPDEKEAFSEFVNKIEAKGGGDEPENALEALALAMKSDWVQEGNSRRHAILLFTDASAHKLDKAVGLDIPAYPKEMLHSYGELDEAWNACQGTCVKNETSAFNMDARAKRLILYAPDAEPWSDIELDFENCVHAKVQANGGVDEIDKEIIIKQLCKSCK